MEENSSEILISMWALYQFCDETVELKEKFRKSRRKINKLLKADYINSLTREILESTSDNFKQNIATLKKIENGIIELTKEIEKK